VKPTAFERDDKIYLVAPVVPHRPTQNEIEEYAFGKTLVDDLKRSAPNENIAWFGGHYVEADQPNLNGAMWLGDDLAIASITPVMMPVTVMHDPRTAVGVIAHAELLLPPDVPRAKIDTALGLWKHRFPEAVAEAEANYSSGTLFQSMECHAPRYECSECRMPFMKLRDGAEKDQWCEHLKASNPSGGYTAKGAAPRGNRDASRILRNVTFTGTGLIFGGRGGKGADPLANLEAFQDEVAEFHAGRREPPPKSRSTSRRKRTMEIDDREYADLIAAKSERDSLKGRVGDLEVEAAKVPDLQKQIETTEAEKVKAEGERDAAAAKVQEAEERANKQTLRDERWEKLGSGFTTKIDGMPTTKANLLRDAEGLDENAWDARLKEVEEATATKRDAKKEGDDDKGGKDDKDDKGGDGGNDRENAIFRQEEVARFQGGGGGGAATSRVQTPGERRSVMAGLLKPPAKK
jgi:hypothetical protein